MKLNELENTKPKKKVNNKKLTNEEIMCANNFIDKALNNKDINNKIGNDYELALNNHQFTKNDYDKRISLVKNSLTNLKDEFTKDNCLSTLNDEYTNPQAGYGFMSGSPQDAGQYISSRGVTRDFINLNNVYRSDAIFSKIINMYARDMVKNGIDIRCDKPTDQVSKIECEITKLNAQIQEGIMWSDLYGLSVGLPIIHGQFNQSSFSRPLDISKIDKDDFMGIKILPKWQGCMPLMDKLVTKPIKGIIDGSEIGEPLYYDIWITNTGQHYKVHRSWLFIFITNPLPGIEKDIEQYSGVSLYERLEIPLKNYNATINYILSLLQMSTQRVIKLEGITGLELLSKAGQDRFQKRMEQLGSAATIWNILVLGENDDYDYKSVQFNGLNSLALTSQENLAAASSTSLNRLFGKSPTGLNNSSEENTNDYYDTIKGRQECILRPSYNKLIPILYRNEYGEDIGDFEFDFESLWSLSEQDKALILERKSRSLQNSWKDNALTLREYLLELKQIGRVTDAYTNITDEYLQKIHSSGLDDYRFVDFEVEKNKKLKALAPKEKTLKEATITDAKERIKLLKEYKKGEGNIKNVLK